MLRQQARLNDEGSSTVEIAVLGPALLLLIFSIVQVALWFYARSLALAAAQEGATAAGTYGSTPIRGVDRARSFLDRSAGDSLQSAAISTQGSTATAVRISVTGRSLSVLPGLPGILITQSATRPVERFSVAGR